MVETKIYLNGGSKEHVGHIYTASEIKGSRVNDYKVQTLLFYLNEVPDRIQWVIDSVFRIPGAVRPQKIWNFVDYTETESELTLHGTVLRPEGLCVACSGTGTFKSYTHKATAKCPGCKGTGFTNVWVEETEDGDTTVDSGRVVEESESKDATGISSS